MCMIFETPTLKYQIMWHVLKTHFILLATQDQRYLRHCLHNEETDYVHIQTSTFNVSVIEKGRLC